MSKERTCSHGKTFKVRCIECELILARERADHAKDSWHQYSKLIVKLEAEQRMKDAANVR